MIKALLLIFEPVAAWNRIALARRSLFFMVFLYLLPMMLIVAVAEAFGLVEWGREQHLLGGVHLFPIREAVVLECTEMALMGLAIVVCAYLIKSFGETFHLRNTYQQAFTVVIYGLSPLFLFRLLDVTPAVNPWIVWIIGILFSVRTLYMGVPRVMESGPAARLGPFFHERAGGDDGDGRGACDFHRLSLGQIQAGFGRALSNSHEIPSVEMKASAESQLLDALMELEGAVKTMRAAKPKPDLVPIFSRIDELARRLPRETDPTLLHYLHKKSYEKARLYLMGRDAENQAEENAKG